MAIGLLCKHVACLCPLWSAAQWRGVGAAEPAGCLWISDFIKTGFQGVSRTEAQVGVCRALR